MGTPPWSPHPGPPTLAPPPWRPRDPEAPLDPALAAEAARAVLPAWVPWVGPVGQVLLGVLLSAAIVAAVAAWTTRAARGAADQPWTEHAVACWQARRTTMLVALAALVCAAGFPVLFAGPVSGLPPVAVGALCLVAALPGVLLLRARQEAALAAPPTTAPGALRGGLSRTVAAMGHLVLALLLAALIPPTWTAGLAAAAVVAGATLLWTRAAGVDLCRLLGLARPADPALLSLVEEARARLAAVDVRPEVRRVDVLDWHLANAFAFPAAGRLVFTRGALAHLDHDALVAITAHELGHLAEPPQVVRARTLVALGLAPLVLLKPVVVHGTALAGIALLAGVLAVLMAGARLARRMEEAADAHGHGHSGDPDDPVSETSAVYARALEAAHRVNRVPPVLGGRRSHPDLIDRMRAAGVEPSWPVPDPPRARGGVLVGLGAVLAWGAVVGVLRVGAVVVVYPAWLLSPDLGLLVAASHGMDDWTLGLHRDELAEDLLLDEARIVNDLARVEAPHALDPVLAEVVLAGALGDCEAADAAWAQAQAMDPVSVTLWSAWPDMAQPWLCPGESPEPAVPVDAWDTGAMPIPSQESP